METESMVHALKEIQRLLKPDGILIDIHPQPQEPLLEVLSGGEVLFSRPLAIDYLEDIIHAERALKRVVALAIFHPDRKLGFDYVHHASTPTELRRYWEELSPYDDKHKDEALVTRQNELFDAVEEFIKAQDDGDFSEIIIRENSLMSRYMRMKE